MKRKKTDDRPQIVIIGDPCDGFVYYGPFSDADAASEWAEREVPATQVWWIADLRREDD